LHILFLDLIFCFKMMEKCNFCTQSNSQARVMLQDIMFKWKVHPIHQMESITKQSKLLFASSWTRHFSVDFCRFCCLCHRNTRQMKNIVCPKGDSSSLRKCILANRVKTRQKMWTTFWTCIFSLNVSFAVLVLHYAVRMGNWLEKPSIGG